MAGLDAIKKFSTGGSNSTPEAAPADTNQNEVVETKGVQSKYLPAVSGTSPLDAEATKELRERMQELVARQTSPWAQFMGGINKAYAAAAGPDELMKYQQQEDIRNQNLMSMQSQLAQYESGQRQAQLAGQRLDKLLPNAGTQGAAPAGGFVGGMQTGVKIDDSTLARIANARAKGNDLLAEQIYDDYLKTYGTKRLDLINKPEYYEQKEYNVPNRGRIWMNGPELEYYNQTGILPGGVKTERAGYPGLQTAAQGAPSYSGSLTTNDIAMAESHNDPNTPPSPKGAQGPMQVMPKTQRDPGFGVKPAQNDSPEELRRVGDDYYKAMQNRYKNDYLAAIAYNWGPSNADDWIAKGANYETLPDETKGYLKRAYTYAANRGQTDVPTQPSTSTQFPAPPVQMAGESNQSYESRMATYKADIAERQKGIGKQAEETANFLNTMQSGAEAAAAKRPMLAHIAKHADEHPDEFNVSAQTSGRLMPMSAAINWARDQHGEEAAKNREKSMEPYFFSKDAIGRRADTDRFAGQLAMGSSKELIGDSSVRLGAQIEKLFLDFKGLGTNAPASTNKNMARMYDIMMERKIRQNEIAQDFVRQHPAATPNDIITSPAYKAVDSWASQALSGAFGANAAVTEQDMARQELKRRKEAKGNQ